MSDAGQPLPRAGRPNSEVNLGALCPNPLSQREKAGVKLPLPLGEGGGEGCVRADRALVIVVVPTPASLATSEMVVTRSRARSLVVAPGVVDTPLLARQAPGATSSPTPPR